MVNNALKAFNDSGVGGRDELHINKDGFYVRFKFKNITDLFKISWWVKKFKGVNYGR